MKYQMFKKVLLAALLAAWISGCAVVEVAMVGAGKSATADDTGFLKSYGDLAAAKDAAYPNLPDLSYVSPRSRINAYGKVLMPDFTSMNRDMSKLMGLQVRQYKSIKQELPDQLANTFDGSAFTRVSRTTDRVDPRDIEAIKRLPADAVLFGNIKELVSLGGDHRAGLTAIQVEYKLVDVRTGEEVVTAIHRSTTDLDKVAMAQVRVLGGLFTKARSVQGAATGGDAYQPAQANPNAAGSRSATGDRGTGAPNGGKSEAMSTKAMSPKEAQERLQALGYSPGVPDGVMGKRSVNALKKFQQDKGIPATGALDQETIRKLRGG